jgi:hypothetical protein
MVDGDIPESSVRKLKEQGHKVVCDRHVVRQSIVSTLLCIVLKIKYYNTARPHCQTSVDNTRTCAAMSNARRVSSDGPNAKAMHAFTGRACMTFAILPLPLSRLKGLVKTQVCYISGGTFEGWRSDADQFPESIIGIKMSDWDEKCVRPSAVNACNYMLNGFLNRL